MFRELFGEIASGRLARTSYFKYTALLSLFAIVIFFYVLSTIYADMQGVELDWRDLVNLRNGVDGLDFDFFGSITYDIWAFGAVLLFANFNIAVKRIRDAGLPVHWVLLFFFFTYAFAPVMFFVLLEIGLLTLAVLPTNCFAELSHA